MVFPWFSYGETTRFYLTTQASEVDAMPAAGPLVTAATMSWGCPLEVKRVGPVVAIGKPQENHRKTIGKWWFNGILRVDLASGNDWHSH